jgi:hypothetical protein
MPASIATPSNDTADFQATIAQWEAERRKVGTSVSQEEIDATIAADDARADANEEYIDAADDKEANADERARRTLRTARHGIIIRTDPTSMRIDGLDRERVERRFDQRLRHIHGASAVRAAENIRQEAAKEKINLARLSNKQRALETQVGEITDRLTELYAFDNPDNSRQAQNERTIQQAWGEFNSTLGRLQKVYDAKEALERKRDVVAAQQVERPPVAPEVHTRRAQKKLRGQQQMEIAISDGKIRGRFANEVRAVARSLNGNAPETFADKRSRHHARRDKGALRKALLDPNRRMSVIDDFAQTAVEHTEAEQGLDTLLRSGPHPTSLNEEAALSSMLDSMAARDRARVEDSRQKAAARANRKPEIIDDIPDGLNGITPRGVMKAALARLVR